MINDRFNSPKVNVSLIDVEKRRLSEWQSDFLRYIGQSFYNLNKNRKRICDTCDERTKNNGANVQLNSVCFYNGQPLTPTSVLL